MKKPYPKYRRVLPRIFVSVLLLLQSFVGLLTPQAARAATAPSVPQNFYHTVSASSITLNWSTPIDDGGSAITGYYARIRAHGDSLWSSLWVQNNLSSLEFAGLTANGHYDIAIAAINDIGTSDDSVISDITVGAVPDEVDGFSFTNNGTSLYSSWVAPANPGSSAITSYEFAYSLAGENSWDTYSLAANSTSAQINGLLAGRYDIRVRAINDFGAGDWSYVYNQYLGPYYYNITNCEQLQAMQNKLDATYSLANDIDCTGVNFTPIGTYSQPFFGSLEGNGHTISNLYVEAQMDYVGLFGAIDAAHIQNVIVSGEVRGGAYTGGLAGWANNLAVIDNVTSHVNIAGGSNSGGLIGYAAGINNEYPLTITESTTTGEVLGGDTAGGLVGYANSVAVTRSSASGAIYSVGDNAGGLIGHSLGSEITQSFATGNVVSGSTRAGGLIGESEGDVVSDSYARGNATTPNIYYAGGLIGAMNTSHLSRVYSTGVVNGYGIIGGLVGFNIGGSTITDSFSASYVLPSDPGWDARANNGLVGIDYAQEITYSNVFYNTINNANNCTRDDNFEIVSSADCTGINLQYNETMFKKATDEPINGWDIGGIWHINDNDFPTLSPNTEPQILCEQATRTDTSISIHCMAEPEGWGRTTWEMQYKRSVDSNWINVALADITDAKATITGLTPGTEYMVRFRFTNDWGTGQWGRIDAKTSGVAPVVTVPTDQTNSYIVQLTNEVVTAAQQESIDLSNDKLFLSESGKQLDLKLNQVVYFIVNGERHSATVKEIGADYVILTIASTPFDVRLSLNSPQDIDVDKDGKNDITIQLLATTGGTATLNFKQLSEKISAPVASNDTMIGQINNTLFYLFILGAVSFVLMLLILGRLHDRDDRITA